MFWDQDEWIPVLDGGDALEADETYANYVMHMLPGNDPEVGIWPQHRVMWS